MDRNGVEEVTNCEGKCRIPVIGDYVKLNGKLYCIENLFLEGYYTKVRSCVRSSVARMTGREDVYLGYVYKGNAGKYERYFLIGGLDNVAKFICSGEENKLLCNENDHPLLCSMGKRLDLLKGDEVVKEELMYYVRKFQRSKECQKFIEL